MELGISTWSLPWACAYGKITPSDLIDLAARKGLTRVQLADNLPWDRMEPGELEGLADDAAGRGVTLEAGMRGWEASDISRFMDLALRIRAPLLRIVMVPPERDAYHPTTAEKKASLIGLIPQIRESGLTIGIENHDRFKAGELARMVEELNDRTGEWRFGVCLDTVNSLGALEDPERTVSVLAPWTVNLHLKDFVIARVEHGMGFEVTGAPLGRGMTDIPRLLAALGKYGRCRSAVIEQWVEPELEGEATLKKERQWLEEGIGGMISSLL